MGLETALGVAITDPVESGTLGLPTLIQRLATRPAQVAGLPAGTLRRGAAADVVVFAPGESWVVDATAFYSKSRNTPFAGRTLRGRVRWTLVGGIVVHRSTDRSGKRGSGT